MFSMFFNMALYVIGAGLLGYLVYTLFFAPDRKQHEEKQQGRMKRRFERREIEQGDRRKANQGAPDGVDARRGGRRER